MPNPITPQDLYRFEWIDHVRFHPAGDRVAYQVGWADAEERENRSRILVRSLGADGRPRELAPGPNDSSPEWSPDGALAFLRRMGRRTQVFVLAGEGGEPTQLTSLPDGVGSFRWSPDGSQIAFVAATLGNAEGVVEDPRPPESERQVRRTPVARVVSRFDYKFDGRGYFDGRRHHLFVVDRSGGEARQLTAGDWDVESFSWAPTGNRLAISANAEPDGDRNLETHAYVVALDGTMRKLTDGMAVESVEWSPDGRRIAFVAPLSIDAGRLERGWFLDVDSGEVTCVTESWDRSVGDTIITDMRGGHDLPLRWSAGGERLMFPTSGPGRSGIAEVAASAQVRELVGGARRIYDFDVHGDRLAFLASDPSGPGDLYVQDGAGERRLTQLNGWLAERYLAKPEPITFSAPDGWQIEGWLLKPEGFDAARKHPLVLEVHGGPHGQYGWAFFHEFQVLAGMGFCVLYVNPRGSDGYGEAFRKACVRDWGGADYRDLMAAVDYALSQGFVDEARLGIGGGSYGGFMTNWAIGQSTRFGAAVAMRSISNLVSDYAQNDIVPWSQAEMGPPPWPDLDQLWRQSPIRYVQNVTTPLLLIHGEMDLRCPISQAEEMFGALRLLGKEVELVRFPEESHDLSRSGRPDRRVERLRRIAGWFGKYLLT